MKEKKVHRWEYTGHGAAPFRCVGVVEFPSKAVLEQNPDAYNNAMKNLPKGYGLGTCAICGMALTVNYLINSADGKKFAVGCECVRKADDRNLTSAMNEKRLERERAKRAAKKEEKRQAKEEAERKRNGGKTDAEIAEEAWKVQQKKQNVAKKKRIKLLTPLADQIRDGKFGFCDSVADDMAQGNVPFGRGRSLVAEIIAKQKGRRGSKAFAAKEEEIRTILDKAADIN